jgi:hypothetical protein
MYLFIKINRKIQKDKKSFREERRIIYKRWINYFDRK